MICDGAEQRRPRSAVAIETPHRCALHDAAPLAARLGYQRVAVPVVLAQRYSRRCTGVAVMARIDLPAGRRILVEHRGRQTRLPVIGRGGKTRRAGADDDDVVLIALAWQAVIPSPPCLPCCVSMRMPSLTADQAALLVAEPSIATRQSKHTPIMQ